MKGLLVTATDTEIGKTTITAALAYALRRRGLRVGVMKPIATGCLERNGCLISEDAERLMEASASRDPIEWVCPYRFKPAVAPWVASRSIDLEKLDAAFHALADRHEWLLVEGIGGLLVPLTREIWVADLARRWGLPLLVVARAGLGTINHTLLTLEAARHRGLKVIGVVLNGLTRHPSLAEITNPSVIQSLGRVKVMGRIPHLSQPTPTRVARYIDLDAVMGAVSHVSSQMPGRGPSSRDERNLRRLSRLDRKRIWHPFTQMSEWEKEEPLIIESAEGVWLTDVRGRRYLDGVSSLWVNLHGHRHPRLDRALSDQLKKVAHSTLLGVANIPSIELAEALIRIAPKGLTRVFYSDNGSTAVEVALKMAFQYWQQNGEPQRRRFVHFVNAYHGDTLGCVGVGGIELFHKTYAPLLFDGVKLPAPYLYRGVTAEASLRALESALKRHRHRIAAVVVEPLIQAAAGMITQPAGWVKAVWQACRRHGIFLIADEVAVGFGRTGRMFACEHEGVLPDFLCLAKGLSGGYLPVAATLTTEKVYRGFWGRYEQFRTFFHGHSYTGNPLGCAVALENLRMFREERIVQTLQAKIRLFEEELDRFWDLAHVGDIRQRGLMAGIELVEDRNTRRPYPLAAKMGIRVCQFLRGRGILLRPLGNVVVLMPPLAISDGEIRFLCRQTYEAIRAVTQTG